MRYPKKFNWIIKRGAALFFCFVFIFAMTSCEKKNGPNQTDSEELHIEDSNSLAPGNLTEFSGDFENTMDLRVVPADTPYFKARELETFYQSSQRQYVVSYALAGENVAFFMEFEDRRDGDRYIVFVMDDQGNIIHELDIEEIIQEKIIYAMKIMINSKGDLVFAAWKNGGFDIEKSIDSLCLYEINIQEKKLNHTIELTPSKIAVLVASYPNIMSDYSDVILDSQDRLIICGYSRSDAGFLGNQILVFDNEEFLFALDDFDTPWDFGNILISDGEQVYTTVIEDSKTDEAVYRVHPVNVDEKKLGEPLKDAGSVFISGHGVQRGENELFYINDFGIHQIQPQKNFAEPILLWKDLDLGILPPEATCIIFSTEKILMGYPVYSEGEVYLLDYQWYMLERQEINPNSGKNILRIGGVNIAADEILCEAVRLFNQYSKDTHAEIYDYALNYGNRVTKEERAAKLEIAIQKGDALDLFYENSDWHGNNHFEQYANRKLFLDLKENIKNDPGFEPADFYENILMGTEKDGHINYLSPSFHLPLYYTNEKMTGVHNEDWTIRELNELSSQLQADRSLFAKNTFYTDFLREIMLTSQDEFIDEDGAHFDTVKFQELLEFISSHAIDWRQIEQMYIDGTQWQLDIEPVIVRDVYSSLGDFVYRDIKEPFIVTGCPTVSTKEDSFWFLPQEMIGIFSSSQLQEEAWIFIACLFSEEIQDMNMNSSIPVRRSSFEKSVEAEKEIISRMKVENATWSSEDSDMNSNEKDLILESRWYMKIEQFEYILANIRRIQRLDIEVYKIVEEESEAFFSGNISSKIAAAVIQERVTALLSARS